MSAKVLTLDAAKQAKIEVAENGAGSNAVHQLITAYQANRRTGSAHTKTRGEVRATGRKPYRQKGTGRARAGGNASPVGRGGGVVFGPRARDYSKKMPKAMRRVAFRKVLGERIEAGDVLLTDSFAVADGKTKSFAAAVAALTDGAPVLILSPGFDEATYLAGRNYQGALLESAHDVNAEQLLYFDKIVVTGEAMEILAARTAK